MDRFESKLTDGWWITSFLSPFPFPMQCKFLLCRIPPPPPRALEKRVGKKDAEGKKYAEKNCGKSLFDFIKTFVAFVKLRAT